MEDWTRRENWTLISKDRRMRAAITRFRGQAVIETPEGNLMFAIFAQALHDLVRVPHKRRPSEPKSGYESRKVTVERERESAIRYLEGDGSDMIHAQLCGLDPEWVRSTLLKMNLWPSPV